MKSQGFTLIEILVASTLIAVLSVAGVASYTRINKRSRDTKRKSDVEQVRMALEMYRTDLGYYPPSSGFIKLSALDDGSGSGPLVPTYAPAMPTDPQSTSPSPPDYWYYALVPAGAPTHYYGYCICAKLESSSNTNTCGVSNGTNCNYYLKNP